MAWKSYTIFSVNGARRGGQMQWKKTQKEIQIYTFQKSRAVPVHAI